LKFDKLVEKLKDAKSKNIIESVELRYSDSFSDQINQLKKKLEDDKIKVTVLSWDDKHEQKS